MTLKLEKLANNIASRDSVIDFLRAIAALSVVAVHSINRSSIATEQMKKLSEFGQLGVQLFFVLSAYTLWASLEKSQFTLVRSDYLAFLTKRFFRIAPLFYLAIPIYFFLRCWFNDNSVPYTLFSIGTNIFLVHGLFPPYLHVVPGGWSIGVEFLFYLMLPVFFVWSKNKWIRIILLGFASVLASYLFAKTLYYFSGKAFNVSNNGIVYFSLVTQFPCFVAGIIAFKLVGGGQQKSLIFAQLSLLLSLLMAVILGALWIGDLFDSVKFLLVPILPAAMFSSLLCGFIALSPNWTRVFSGIGERSYSIYIFHFLIISLLINSINQWLIYFGLKTNIAVIVSFFIVAAITNEIAKVSHHLIELPFIRYGSNIAYKLRQSIV